MPASALIVFAKPPLLGKVKTRLAQDIGQAAALAVYKSLLAHTAQIANELTGVDVFVYWSELPENNACRLLFAPHIQHRVQCEATDLGERMCSAFEQLFQQNYGQIVIVGSDCPSIQTSHLRSAFAHLENREATETKIAENADFFATFAATPAVLGAAEDGGYYLLGMTRLIGELFRHKRWSTDTVFADTLADLQRLQIQPLLLETLRDVDRAKDL